MSDTTEPVRTVDARGLRCPQPVIELAAAIGDAETDDLVDLLADDPAARVDVPVWCRMRRHRLVSLDEDDDGVLHFRVQRTGPS